ncbi:hypothetical protein [Nonomuraea insulae]|uniref:Uncharacterized protein n=1 Tax=Nonomuraea insulae TaxID=1616787 RepID=A0ABW1CEF2_9ACTN
MTTLDLETKTRPLFLDVAGDGLLVIVGGRGRRVGCGFAGCEAGIIDVITDPARVVVDRRKDGGYHTFGECWGWGTSVHAWSATPPKDLIWYVLGVTPAEPGYASVRIAPRPGGIDRPPAPSPPLTGW